MDGSVALFPFIIEKPIETTTINAKITMIFVIVARDIERILVLEFLLQETPNNNSKDNETDDSNNESRPDMLILQERWREHIRP